LNIFGVEPPNHFLLEQSNPDTIWRSEPDAELRYIRSIRHPRLYARSRLHLAANRPGRTDNVRLETVLRWSESRGISGKHKRIGS
jgi:hypothetical protein